MRLPLAKVILSPPTSEARHEQSGRPGLRCARKAAAQAALWPGKEESG